MRRLTQQEFEHSHPKSNEEICAVAARVWLQLAPPPYADTEIIEVAHGIAAGLFDHTFDSLSDADKWDWIDMCEEALRTEIAQRAEHELPDEHG